MARLREKGNGRPNVNCRYKADCASHLGHNLGLIQDAFIMEKVLALIAEADDEEDVANYTN